MRFGLPVPSFVRAQIQSEPVGLNFKTRAWMFLPFALCVLVAAVIRDVLNPTFAVGIGSILVALSVLWGFAIFRLRATILDQHFDKKVRPALAKDYQNG